MTVTTYEIIRRIESSDFPMAMRFEPSVYARDGASEQIVKRIMKYNRCSRATAKMIYATSWGGTQIMGFNLYHPNYGLSISVGEFLNSEDAQRALFNLFCAANNIDFSVEQLAQSNVLRDRFARFYNGSVANYSPKILASLQALYTGEIR